MIVASRCPNCIKGKIEFDSDGLTDIECPVCHAKITVQTVRTEPTNQPPVVEIRITY